MFYHFSFFLKFIFLFNLFSTSSWEKRRGVLVTKEFELLVSPFLNETDFLHTYPRGELEWEQPLVPREVEGEKRKDVNKAFYCSRITVTPQFTFMSIPLLVKSFIQLPWKTQECLNLEIVTKFDEMESL